MSEVSVDDAPSGVERRDTAAQVRQRLYRGEHLTVVEEYLDGRLAYSRDDWKTAALISLAMKHHFAALKRAGELKVDVVTEQFDDGLAITVTWPEDRAIDEVDIAFELVDDSGQTSVISRRFAREMAGGQGIRRVFGRTLASDQTVVLRPIMSAATVSAVARPSHRLRFSDRSLAPAMRTCLPDSESSARSDFEFEPAKVVTSNVVDIYGAARGREILEIISLEEQRERVRRERIERRRARQRRALRIAAVTLVAVGLLIGGLLVAARFFPQLADRLPIPVTGPAPHGSPETALSAEQHPSPWDLALERHL